MDNALPNLEITSVYPIRKQMDNGNPYFIVQMSLSIMYFMIYKKVYIKITYFTFNFKCNSTISLKYDKVQKGNTASGKVQNCKKKQLKVKFKNSFLKKKQFKVEKKYHN